MKLLKLLIPCAVTLAVFALPGCATNPYPITTIETEDLLTVEAERKLYGAILPSREDELTPETEEQIEAHNNVYWCRHPSKRPLGFDTSVCDA